MFERGVCHRGHELVWRISICLDDDGMIVALRDVQKSSELLQGNFLVAKINRRNFAPGDADDFLTLLRAKQKGRRRSGNGNSWLQDKVRAQEEKENQQENNVDQWEYDEPAEIIFLCSAEFHADTVKVDLAIAPGFAMIGQSLG